MRGPYDFDRRRPIGLGSMRFSRQEMFEIGVSVAVLTLAFAIVFSQWYTLPDTNGFNRFAIWLLICFVIVLVGFLFHELGHKFAAQSYGAWAEFRMYPKGLALALIVSFLGFIFAAPGAVYIRGMMGERQNGIISVAGPSVNLVVGVLAIAGTLLLSGGMAEFVLLMLARISLILALFNLIPFPPLDGSKVLRWNPIVYFLVAGSSLVLFMMTF